MRPRVSTRKVATPRPRPVRHLPRPMALLLPPLRVPPLLPPKQQQGAPTTPASAASVEEYDPATWAVPVECKDCNEPFSIPYRHFQAGVVFYCPNCSGSFVPNTTLCRNVREAFEGFYGRRRRERALFEERHAKEIAEFETRSAAEAKAFADKLQEMAQSAKPAGKMTRPKGIFAMFT